MKPIPFLTIPPHSHPLEIYVPSIKRAQPVWVLNRCSRGMFDERLLNQPVSQLEMFHNTVTSWWLILRGLRPVSEVFDTYSSCNELVTIHPTILGIDLFYCAFNKTQSLESMMNTLKALGCQTSDENLELQGSQNQGNLYDNLTTKAANTSLKDACREGLCSARIASTSTHREFDEWTLGKTGFTPQYFMKVTHRMFSKGDVAIRYYPIPTTLRLELSKI